MRLVDQPRRKVPAGVFAGDPVRGDDEFAFRVCSMPNWPPPRNGIRGENVTARDVTTRRQPRLLDRFAPGEVRVRPKVVRLVSYRDKEVRSAINATPFFSFW
jgi:hypothetical protein